MKIFNKNLNRNLYNYELDAIPLYDFDKWIGKRIRDYRYLVNYLNALGITLDICT